jgi:hypothetical protein
MPIAALYGNENERLFLLGTIPIGRARFSYNGIKIINVHIYPGYGGQLLIDHVKNREQVTGQVCSEH